MDRYKAILDHLESFIPPLDQRFPKERGLARMALILKYLGNPHLSYPTIHIAGTSGKGSTATILAKILSTAGYKTGLTISPHLQVINERMQINGKMISVVQLEKLVAEIKPVIRRVEQSPLGKPTYFEILLGLAFLYFAKEKVDIAVIEAGLGGRWDGTNVVKPLIGIITNIGLDHTEILGDTVEKIAQDKTGIIKPEMIVISGVNQQNVRDILSAKCNPSADGQSAKLLMMKRDFGFKINKITNKGTTFDFRIGDIEYKDLILSLIGTHQVENAALALAAAIVLNRNKYKVSETTIRSALITVNFPGRLELVQQNPLVVLDGAHNTDKVKALVEALPLFPKKKWIGVFAAKYDKNVAEMLKLFIPQLSTLILTEFQSTTDLGKGMAMPAKQVEAVAQRLWDKGAKGGTRRHLLSKLNAHEAVKKALALAGKNGNVIITGSLYLVGQVRQRWHPREKLLRLFHASQTTS